MSGCGNGDFLKHLRQANSPLDLYGIDLSGAAGQAHGIHFEQGDFLTHPFDRKFDAIVSLAVIEHLDDVASFVGRVHGLLNPHGRAYIMTLNESGVLYRLANLMRLVGASSVFMRLYDPHHLNHFSKGSLACLMTRRGLFRLERTIDHNAPLSAIDVPASNPISRFILMSGVAAVFLLGKLSGGAYLQTLVLEKVE